MAKGTTKRGFIPPQPAAALSSLDFAAASQAFNRALALKPRNEAEASAAGDVIAELADRLLGVPASAPADIAEKVSAYAWFHNHAARPLSDPETQRHIAQRGADAAKGLLAIYLDLTHSRPDHIAQAYHPEWDQILARYDAANAVWSAGDDPTEEQVAAWRTSRAALLSTRAPNAKALACKLARLIEDQFTDAVGDSSTNPATISRMLADAPIEQAVASAYQDALALAGEAGPLVTAQPDPFDPEAWLAEIEGATGAHIVSNGTSLIFTAGRGGADLPGAIAANEALSFFHGQRVSGYLLRHRYQAPPAYIPSPPTPPEEIRALFLNGYLNTFPQGERDAIRAKLEAGA